MITFEIPGKPQPKQRARSGKTKNGKTIHYTPAKTENFEAKVGWIATHHVHGRQPSNKPFALRVVIWVEIPPSWPQWKRQAAWRGEIAATTKLDGDNVAKSIMDALNGVIYKDDRQVTSLQVDKFFGDHWSTRIELIELDAQPAQLARRPAA